MKYIVLFLLGLELIFSLLILLLYHLINSIKINDTLYISNNGEYVKVIDKDIFCITITKVGSYPMAISTIDFLLKYKKVKHG